MFHNGFENVERCNLMKVRMFVNRQLDAGGIRELLLHFRICDRCKTAMHEMEKRRADAVVSP